MTRRRGHLDGLAIGLMLTCCVLWGVQQVVVKATLPALPPFLQAAFRSAIAAAMLWIWSRVSVFIYLAPFVVALALPRFEPTERLSAVQMAGLVAAFAALAFAFQEGFASAKPMQWVGDGLAILAAILWGATTLVVRATRLATTVPEKTLFYQLAASAVLLAGAAIAAGEHWPAGGLPWWAWASLAFQAIVIAFASYLTWFWLLRHYPATRLSAFSFLTPVFGLVFASLALGEPIGVRLIVAMVFIAIGIALVNGKKSPQAATNAGVVRELP